MYYTWVYIVLIVTIFGNQLAATDSTHLRIRKDK